MRYRRYHITNLVNELSARYSRLLDQVDPGPRGMSRPDDLVEVDGARIRMAVDDFKVILAELRKLK